MTASSETLSSYVPSLIVQRLVAQPDTVASPRADRFPSAVLFADISGFTALTERLAQRGPAGAEQLSLLLNDYFGELVGLVVGQGGDIVKFAGDALIALWPAERERELSPEGEGPVAERELLAEATLRAAQCGQAIQQRLYEYQATDDVRLSLRVSVGSGEVVTSYVGGVYGRWEVVIAGEPLLQINNPDYLPRSGDVMLTPEAWELVRKRCSGVPRASGSVLLERVLEGPLPLPEAQPHPLNGSESALRAFIPGAVLSRLAAGQTDWLAELRHVTVLFINLPDLSHQTPLEQAQAVMQSLQTTLYRYEGSINKLSVDDKGISLLAAFGLPPLSHEDDPVRGVQAALALQQVLREQGLRSAIGVTTGRAFCGTIGTDLRREYTMIGDVVNLAARLMQAAAYLKEVPRDQMILCDVVTHAAATTRLTFGALPPITVKGKAEPVAIYYPLGEEKQTVRPQMAMVGRVGERTLLADQLQNLLRGGSGGLVVIEGEAGIGKSRLVADLVEQAEALGVTCFTGAGDAVEKSTPYYAWRPVFSQLLDLSVMTDPEARRQHALDLMELVEPELYPFAALLNTVLALDIPDNELTLQMSGEVRAENTRDLLLQFLQSSVARSPKVLILEDAHWLDSASWLLALAASERVRPLLLVLVTRPLGEPVPLEYGQMLSAARTHQLRLSALSQEETLALVCRRLGVAALPAEAAQLIRQKAEGHPFFSEELAYALRDAGLLLIEDGVCQLAPQAESLLALDFPDTIQGVITSRIDRLAPQQQLALKVASVIGRVFALRTLSDIYPIKADTAELPGHLTALERLEIMQQETPEPDLSYVFKHAITQEVAYNLMLFAQRRELHRAVAEWYERTYADDLSPYYPLLAHHWGKAEDHARTLDYLELAGAQARRHHANQEALRFLNEAIALDAQGATPSRPERRARWLRQIGEAFYDLGRLRESRAYLERALALLGWPVPASRWRLIVASAGAWGRRLLQHARRHQPLPLEAPEREALLEAAFACDQLSQVYYFGNESLRSAYMVLQGMNLATPVGPSAPLARLSASASVATDVLGLHRLARGYARAAEEMARQVKDLPSQAWVLTTTAMYRLGLGQWDHARSMLVAATAIYERLGDRRNWGAISIMTANLDFIKGSPAESLRQLAALYPALRDNGNALQQMWVLLGQGLGQLRLGRVAEARQLVEQLRSFELTDRDQVSAILINSLQARVALRSGELALAWEAVDALSALIGDHTVSISFTLLEGYTGFAEAAVRRLELARELPGSERAYVLRVARQAVKALRHYAYIYPIGLPRFWVVQGLLLWLEGKAAKASKAWEKALEAAERLNMPYELGLAHYEIGRHAARPQRHHHLAHACEIFNRLGAVDDLALAQDALKAA